MDAFEDEQCLREAVLRGEPGAAEALFDRVFDALYSHVCASLGGDHHAAEDVVSETLIAGLRGLPGFRGDSSLLTWFRRIAERKVADRARRRRPEVLEVIVGDNGELDDLLGAARAAGGSALEDLASEELRRLVCKALDDLPPRHGTVLRWKYYDESSLGEIALRLHVSPTAAERRLARARAALATLLRRRRINL